MARVTYNGQSFSIDSRRVWLLAASMQYARIPEAAWADRLAAVRQAGFNTVETACPWLIHEPRKGRFDFESGASPKRFIELCGEADLRVVLRAGPYIGDRFDGGGLPNWLTATPGVGVRESEAFYLDRAGRYFRKLFNELSGLQASKGGPILLVQCEHAWTCANDLESTKYLAELMRIIRECGINVPVTVANDLWQGVPGAIDIWRGSADLLAHGRQLRTVLRDAPRLVMAVDEKAYDTWGAPHHGGASANELMTRVAEILASGAQPIVSPFHGGTNFGFLGGRIAGRADGFVTSSVAPAAPLGEAGHRGRRYYALKRIMTFADHFGHVFAEFDPEYQPTTTALPVDRTGPSSRSGADFSVVAQRGTQGRVVFVFALGKQTSTTLLLDGGVRLPIDLGSQRVGWFVFDVDISGTGRMDYANLCPLAIVDRNTVVLYGPKGHDALLSFNGKPLQAKVPSGAEPAVVEHNGATFVILNEDHVDGAYPVEDAIYIGISGFDAAGEPIAAASGKKAMKIGPGQKVEALKKTTGASRRGKSSAASIAMDEWRVCPADAYVVGESPRYASLSGPADLHACGASIGYGWYRVQLRITAARKRMLHLPQAADRTHLFVNGKLDRIFGVGPDASRAPFASRFVKGNNMLVALVDNMGRFAEGNDLPDPKGFAGHLYTVKQMTTARAKQVKTQPVDPFALRGFIAGRTNGQMSDSEQLAWAFSHARKTPVIVNVKNARCTGTFVLNDRPHSYYAGATGGCFTSILLDPAKEDSFKRGKNVLRFAPDARQDGALAEMTRAAALYEGVETLTASAQWSFAKWEPPPASGYRGLARTAATALRGTPAWWKSAFKPSAAGAPLWFDTTGLSKGQIYVNGHNLGRYFTATRDGKPVGPQKWLYVPDALLNADAPNELLIFDEHGFSPSRTKLMRRVAGELEE